MQIISFFIAAQTKPKRITATEFVKERRVTSGVLILKQKIKNINPKLAMIEGRKTIQFLGLSNRLLEKFTNSNTNLRRTQNKAFHRYDSNSSYNSPQRPRSVSHVKKLSKNAQSQFELDFFNDLEDKIEEEIFKIENEPGYEQKFKDRLKSLELKQQNRDRKSKASRNKTLVTNK